MSYRIDQTPVIVLWDVPQAVDLPPLQSTDGRIAPCAGWVVAPGGTVCIVDGPVDSGFVLGALDEPWSDSVSAEDVPYEQWLAAVVVAGGAVIVACPIEDRSTALADVLSGPGLRGGYIPQA